MVVPEGLCSEVPEGLWSEVPEGLCSGVPEGLSVLDGRGVVSCETGARAVRCFTVYVVVANYGVFAPPVIR